MREREKERERRGNFRIILVCAPSSIIASTLLNVGHLKNYFSFFPLFLSLSLPLFSLASHLPVNFFLFSPLSLSLSFNYMKRDSTRGRCDKRGNNDEKDRSLSQSSRRVAYLSLSPFSTIFPRFFSHERARYPSERVEEREYTPVWRLI